MSLACLALLAAGQVPKLPPPPEAPPVVRVSVQIVQVDAVVTDDEGRQVTDLTPADFVIKEGGQEREVAYLSYVRLAAPTTSAPTEPPPPAPSPGAEPALAPRLRTRTITIVVDDLNLSYESLVRLRDALHQYIDTRLSAGDRVAVLRTGGGTSVREQFTSDTARLHAAVDGLRYSYAGMAGVGGPDAIDSQMVFGGGPNNANPSGRQPSEGQKRLDRFRREMVEVGTIGALRRIVKGLAPFPGRKPVIVFSEGFRIDRHDGLTEPYIRALTDEANRASVALYAIDARGLETDALSAADNVTYLGSDVVNGGADAIRAIPSARARARFDGEESLAFLADRTGGLMVRASNDPGRGLDRVLADQEGYYLIGYTPPASFFETAGGRPRFHKIQVTVRRRGLHVRSRAGFYGVPDAAAAETASRGARLAAALASPFAAPDVGLRLQALFVDDEKTGPTLRAMLRIDGHDLTFVERPAGGWQVVLDVAAVTHGSGGAAVDRKDQTFTISTQGVERPGPDTAFYYTLDLPVTKPGPYQFRVVVQDTATERLGAASEVVVVPDLEGGRLALSGILVRGAAGQAPSAVSDGTQALVGRVKPGGFFDYAFQILNARPDPATKKPRLTTQARLWRGRQLLYEGPETPLATDSPDVTRIAAGGRLDLSSRLPAGDYVLEVKVVDAVAGRNGVATQWVDLEAVAK